MSKNTYKLKKSEIKEIIKEEVARVITEIDDPTSVDLREMTQKAIANLEEHSDLLKEITYYLSHEGYQQQDLLELIKAHGVYMGFLERILEDLR